MVDKDLKKFIPCRNQTLTFAMTAHDALSIEVIKPTGNQANYCEFYNIPNDGTVHPLQRSGLDSH